MVVVEAKAHERVVVLDAPGDYLLAVDDHSEQPWVATSSANASTSYQLYTRETRVNEGFNSIACACAIILFHSLVTQDHHALRRAGDTIDRVSIFRRCYNYSRD